jgi:predicted NAD/FAD-binding protein
MKIAIVGTGISGLVCGWLLQRDHDVTLFEANDYIGGHTHTVPVDLSGRRYDVDTGFIVYNERTYPAFTEILRRLDVPTQATEMSFSVRADADDLEYNGSSLNSLFVQRRNLIRPSFLRMVRDILRFGREALPAVRDQRAQQTIGEFVAERRYGRAFVDHYLEPMGAAIWSCPLGTFRQFPLRFVVEFMHNHGLLTVSGRPQWRVISGGSARYVEALTAGFRDRIRLRTPVRAIRRAGTAVEVATDGGPETFEHVVLACHSDEALGLLADASPVEHELLSAFPYQANDAVLHTDPSVLPRRRGAWASWNYRLHAGEEDRSTVTYNMNILQGLDAPEPICVTLNDTARIDPARVLGRYQYAHPVFTANRADAQRRHLEVVNLNRTSFCGAYWRYGFHEDGVQSALAVCGALGRTL